MSVPKHSAGQTGADAISVTWSDLSEGKVVLRKANGAAKENWKTVLLPAAAASAAEKPPSIIVEPAAKTVVDPQEKVTFHFNLAPGAKAAPGSEARYFFALDRTVAGKTSREVTMIEVRPVFRLAKQGTGAKYVLTASRTVPFVCGWTIETPLLLRDAHDASVLANHEGQRLGVVYASNATGMDNGAFVTWGAANTKTNEIPLKIEQFSPWNSNKMSGSLMLPDGQTVDVVVETRDFVLYPILVIGAGVLVAWGVKQFFARGRAAGVLKATLADTEARLRSADEVFQRAAFGRPFAGFQILPAWRQFRSDAESDLQLLQLKGGSLDGANADFNALSKRVDEARQIPKKWTAFGASLAVLDELRAGIASLAAPVNGLSPRPTIEEDLSAAERGASFGTLGDFDNRVTRVNAATDSAREWRASWDRAARLALLLAGKPELAGVQEAQRRLWQDFDSGTMGTVKDLLRAANDAVAKSGGAPLAERETVSTAANADAVPSSPLQLVRRGDALSLLAAFVLAIVVGLNTEYFPKPFGSLSDYARVLAWALSASVGIELASLTLDKVGGALSGTAQRVTRA